MKNHKKFQMLTPGSIILVFGYVGFDVEVLVKGVEQIFGFEDWMDSWM